MRRVRHAPVRCARLRFWGGVLGHNVGCVKSRSERSRRQRSHGATATETVAEPAGGVAHAARPSRAQLSEALSRSTRAQRRGFRAGNANQSARE